MASKSGEIAKQVSQQAIGSILRNPKVWGWGVLVIAILFLAIFVIGAGSGVSYVLQQSVGSELCISGATKSQFIEEYKKSYLFQDLSDEEKEAEEAHIEEAFASSSAACGGFGYTGAMYPPAFGMVTDDYGVREASGRWHGGIDIQYSGTSPYADKQPPAVVATDKNGKSVSIQPCEPAGCRWAQDGTRGDNTCGQPIYAVFGGEVLVGHGNDPGGEGYDSGTYAGGGGRIGNIIIKVKEDLYLRYYHTRSSSDIVIPGQIVDAGQVIGYSWSNGNTTACHVHFEIWNSYPGATSNCPVDATVPAVGGISGDCKDIVGGTYNPTSILAQNGFWYKTGAVFHPQPEPAMPAPGSSVSPVVPIPDWATTENPITWDGGWPTAY